jgi:hypothetical protein
LPEFFSSAFKKLNNFKFCEICGYKKGMTTIFFTPLAVFGSEIWGSGMGKNLGKKNIPDPGSATMSGTLPNTYN